jgi:hypothetical protein
VTDRELETEEFRYDVRRFFRGLKLNPHSALEHLTSLLRDAPCSEVFVGNEWIELDFRVLEFGTFTWWYRDLCRLPPAGVPTRLRPERRQAFRTLATMGRMIFPAEAALRGKRAANDDSPLERNSHP